MAGNAIMQILVLSQSRRPFARTTYTQKRHAMNASQQHIDSVRNLIFDANAERARAHASECLSCVPPMTGDDERVDHVGIYGIFPRCAHHTTNRLVGKDLCRFHLLLT